MVGRKVAALLLLAVSLQLVFGLGLGQSRKLNAEFCEITDAQLLADRAQMQGPRVGVQLLTNRRDVGPGEVITARLANFTLKSFLSGAEFKIQRYGSSGWQTDPSSPDGPWPRRGVKLRAGKTSGCFLYFVEKDQPAGRYRFLTMVNTLSETKTQRVPEAAKFVIQSHSGR